MKVRRILAPNPSLFTGPGTNTYLIEDGEEALILDPGPIEESHKQAILEASEGLAVQAVVVTHTHPDHAPLANPLAAQLEVPTLGFQPGPGFRPDHRLSDGETIGVGASTLQTIHTPGHADDHLCFRSGDLLFTGDHIMGGSSVLITDAAAYMTSLEKLVNLRLRRLYPGHGQQIERPAEAISWYIAHRRRRESEIREAVASGCRTVGEVVDLVYQDVNPDLHDLAAWSVAAHLRKLANEGVVRYEGPDGPTAPVDLAPE